MNYEELITTVSHIVENEAIHKKGLTLLYILDEKNHKQMNEELFYRSNDIQAIFTPSDEFEVTLGGVLVKFVKPIIKTDD